jgi:hypothetical protein
MTEKTYSISKKNLQDLLELWADLQGLRTTVDARKDPAAIMMLNQAVLRIDEIISLPEYKEAFEDEPVVDPSESISITWSAEDQALADSSVPSVGAERFWEEEFERGFNKALGTPSGALTSAPGSATVGKSKGEQALKEWVDGIDDE